MWRMAVWAAGVLLLLGCGESQTANDSETQARESPQELGAPVQSSIEPAVVPAAATLDSTLRSGEIAVYKMPAGTTEPEILDWYMQHMPRGEDFHGLEWLEALPPSDDFGWDWYWCSGQTESLDVSFVQNSPEDGGGTYVTIARQSVSDGACLAFSGRTQDSSASATTTLVCVSPPEVTLVDYSASEQSPARMNYTIRVHNTSIDTAIALVTIDIQLDLADGGSGHAQMSWGGPSEQPIVDPAATKDVLATDVYTPISGEVIAARPARLRYYSTDSSGALGCSQAHDWD